MSVSFPSLPTDLMLPFTYTEFDPSGASEGLTLNSFVCLVVGQMFESGEAEPLVPQRVTSAAGANRLFGQGSMAARMSAFYLGTGSTKKLMVIPCLDAEEGEAAKGNIHFNGTASQGTPACLYIGGQLVRAACPSGTTAADLARALAEKVNASPELPVTAANEDGTLVLTARHKGECGNDLDLRFGYQEESFPGGITYTVTPMSGGAGNPDALEVIASMGNDRYHFIAWPWLDQYSMTAIKAEMDDRWSPIRQIDGQVVVVKTGSYAEAVTYSSGHNNKSLTVLPSEGSPTPSYEDAAASMAILAYYGNSDPARGFNTLVIPGVSAPWRQDLFSDIPEKNLGLQEGLSARYVNPDGAFCFTDVITTYRLSSLGAEDTAYLSLNSPLTLSYLRGDWNGFLQTGYPRHKLASDEDAERFDPTQPIMYPKLGKSLAIGRFGLWLREGLVEGSAQFKRDIVVERNARNRNRMDWLMRPDLMNQFKVAGTLIRHIV